VQVVAVLLQELRVGVVKCQPIAASLQLGHVVVTFPVFVARYTVWIESVIVRTLELFSLAVNLAREKQDGHEQTNLDHLEDRVYYW
jgi:hypothetical protein